MVAAGGVSSRLSNRDGALFGTAYRFALPDSTVTALLVLFPFVHWTRRMVIEYHG